MKRIISIVMLILMVMALLPVSIFTVDAASYTSPANISEDEVIKKINNLVSLLDKKYFTTTQKSCGNNSCDYCYNVNVFNSTWFKNMFGTVSVSQIPGHAYPNGSSGTPAGWTCHGFVNFAMWYIFSSSQTDKVLYNRIVDDVTMTKSNVQKYLKPGDVIRYGGHSVVFISANDSNFTVLDCNAQLSGDGYARVRKHTITYKSNYIMAVSRAKNYVDSMLTIQYNVNGGTIPAIHSYKVTTSDSVLRLRSEPSLSATNLTQIPNGETITATATATADGYTWAKTTYGGYTGWCAVSGGLATRLGYYVQSDSIYQYSDMKIFTQKWKQGTGSSGGLTDYDTFKLEKADHTFVGWSLSKDGSTTIFDQNDKTLKAEDVCPDVKNGDQTVTLYAIWANNTPATLTFQYNANGGAGSMAASTATQGNTLLLKNNSFTKTGYDFMGWNIQRQDGAWYADNGVWCSEDALSAKRYSKALLKNGESLVLTSPFVAMSGNHSYTLYAVWRDASIQTIYVTSMAKKDLYYVSDSINIEDLVLAVKYKDGSFATVTEGFTCSPATLTAEGRQLVTVTYEGISTAYTVPVTAVKTFKKNATASAKKDCYLLPNTSAESFLYPWTGDELTILCKDGDFYLGFYPWMDEKITEANGVLVYIPQSIVTLDSGISVPDASSYYSINRNGKVVSSAKVYHRTNTSKAVTSSGVDKTVIATLSAGSTVKVLFEMNGYYCIQTSSYTGFVAKSAVVLNPALCGIQSNVGSMTATMGEPVNTSAVRLNAVYSDGTTVAVTDFSLTLPSTDTAGIKYAMIQYEGLVTHFTVAVISPNVSNLSIQTNPTKDKYLIGDSFDPAGMSVQAVYENGTIEDVPLSNLQYQYNFAEPGYTTVRVEYMGQYAEVMVLVYTPPVFTIGDTAGYIGETISVSVLCMSDEMYIDGYSLAMTLTYDATTLQYRGFTASEYIEGTRLIVNPSESGKLMIAYAHDSSIPLNTLLIELQFTIIAEPAENSVCNIGFDTCEFYDGKSVPYVLKCENSLITNLGYVKVEYRTEDDIAEPEQHTVKYGQKILVSDYIPVREGYIFCGWSLIPDSDSTDYKPGDTIDCLYSITLYAVWEAKLVGQWGIVLEDDLKVRFCLNVDPEISDTAIIRVSIDQQVYEYSVSNLPKMNEECYLITVNLAPAEMTEEIVIQLMDDNTVIKEATHSVRQYCDTILADDNQSKYHAIVKEMLHYGAMAQKYFGYNTDSFANEGISGVASEDVPETAEKLGVTDKISSLNFYGASLVYRDRIAVRYYFTGDVTGKTFTANGNTYTPVEKDGMYYIEVADILPQDLDQQITLTVTDVNGNALSVAYGPMNYIVRMNVKGSDSLKNLVKALYNYHLAAKQLCENAA